ncbi:MAG: hypothetical protein WC145_08590 [Aliarcobacter sp.]
MKTVTGIELKRVEDYRESAVVGIGEGENVVLPLIKLKDSHLAEVYLSRLSTISAEWEGVTARSSLYRNMLAQYAEQTKDELRQVTQAADAVKDEEDSPEIYDDVIARLVRSGTMTEHEIMRSIGELQERLSQMIKQTRKITIEIQEFLAPYLEGTPVLEILQNSDDVHTQQVLYAMLYGAGGFEKEEDTKKK